MTEIRLIDSIHQISPDSWNRLWATDYPFIQHAFLAALEDSGCTCAKSGWAPSHLIVENQGQAIAAMPMYLKTHSYGEYVFDWAWADAYRRSGLNYYPKLVNAIPFTPATGPRLATTAEGGERNHITAAIAQFLSHHCQQHHISGWHSLFHSQDDNALWQHQQLLSRIGCQFHWHNQGFSQFDDFLATFNSRKRKSLRKERKQVLEAGVTLTRLTGKDISREDWDYFYAFYHTTYLKRSGNSGYLNREFFQAIADNMADQILMVKAERQGHIIAAALCFFDQQHLFGRYWGCREEVAGLHFEACYYQGIEFAIERGIQVFDPGAQGEHKIQRGFEPTLTYSGHWLSDSRFYAAVEDFLQREAISIQTYRRDCESYLPFKSTN